MLALGRSRSGPPGGRFTGAFGCKLAHNEVMQTWCEAVRVLFFFSSRRRHTRYWRDWSSDVCSSDLLGLVAHVHEHFGVRDLKDASLDDLALGDVREGALVDLLHAHRLEVDVREARRQIGRASCRERV